MNFSLFNITVNIILLILVTLVPIIITLAFYTLAERKIMAAIQRRRGPNIVGIWGLLQPFADGLKLLLKEIIIPARANLNLFLLAPLLSLGLSLISWLVIPFSNDEMLADLNLGILYLFIISSLSVYSIIIAGWASNSRYPFLGAIRSAAQMISYELVLSAIIIVITLNTSTLNFSGIVYSQNMIWYIWPFLPIGIIFFITGLAETNRAPFDLPEAEAELVAGYNLEYSSIIFAMFFLGEYSNMILRAAFYTCLFFGGWFIFSCSVEFIFVLKMIIICYMFVLVRATFPRARFDQLLVLGWLVLLPFLFSWILFVLGTLVIFNSVPYATEFYFLN
jgi:NADH-quinone oxidoreductase subunit H